MPSNGWVLWVATLAALVVTLIGARHVWVSQREMLLRRAVFVELLRNRNLAQQQDVLERQVAELTAAPRVALRAAELLGMRPALPAERIVVAPSKEVSP